MKKACELCKRMARIHCESDQASLCWDCDATVHSANFLVARHTRNLLCHVCQSPTPWSDSGSKLAPIVVVCLQCVNERIRVRSGEIDEEAAAVEDKPEEMEENQVLPWSPPPPPVPESSSSSGEKPAVTDEVSDDDSESPSSNFNIHKPPPYMVDESAAIVEDSE